MDKKDEYKTRVKKYGRGYWILVVTDKHIYKEKNIKEARARVKAMKAVGIKVRRVYNEFEGCEIKL